MRTLCCGATAFIAMSASASAANCVCSSPPTRWIRWTGAGRQRGQRVRWGGASCLARVRVRVRVRARVAEARGVRVRLASPRLEAAADGAAIVVVEGAAAALHVVEQALLLGLELPHALLKLPPLPCLLRPAVHRLCIGSHLLRVAATQVQLCGVCGSGAEDDSSHGAYKPWVELGVVARDHAHDAVGQQEGH